MTNPVHTTTNPANPPAGQRLQLGSLAASLKVTLADLAGVAGLSRTALHRLLSNEWPARANEVDRETIRLQVEALLSARGATDSQLATVWHAHAGRARANAVDKYGRPLDHVPNPAFITKHEHPEEPDMLLCKVTLTPAARRHFKLFVNPFDGEVVRDEMLFTGPDLTYVSESAWQCSQLGGFVAIVGESGAGKTTMLADLEGRLLNEGRGVTLIKPGVLGMTVSNSKGQMMKATDILHAIISTLQPDATVPQTLQARTVRAAKMLTASAESGAKHLLVIEEAHGLPDATLAHLKRLHEMRRGRTNLLGILLLAQPELKVRLERGLHTGTLREVAQRCEIVELLPLDGDLKAYLQCRAKAANRDLTDLVEDAAVDQLRTRLTRTTSSGPVSMCYPLAVNNMLTKALNRAAEIGVTRVTKDVVASC